MSSSKDSQVVCTKKIIDDGAEIAPMHDDSIIHITSQWFEYLSASERQVLMSVWCRTTRFRKVAVAITPKQLLQGQVGAAFIPATSFERNTARNAVKSLKKLGILIEQNGVYAIDYSVTAIDLSQYEEVQLRVIAANRHNNAGPRTPQDVVEFVSTTMNKMHRYSNAQMRPYSDASLDLTIKKKITVSVLANANGSQPPQYDTVAEAMAAVKEKQNKLKAKRVSRGSAADKNKLFQEAWHRACKERDARYVAVPFTQTRDIPNLRRVIIGPATEAGIDPVLFATFVASNWRKFGIRQFKWMKDYPKQPDLGLLLRRPSDFFDAFNRGVDGDVDKDVTEEAEQLRQKLRQAEAQIERVKEDANIKIAAAKKQGERTAPRRIRPRVINADTTQPLKDWDSFETKHKKGPNK